MNVATEITYSLGFQRLSMLTKKQRNILNQMFINLPLNQIHQAQKDYLASMDESIFLAGLKK